MWPRTLGVGGEHIVYGGSNSAGAKSPSLHCSASRSQKWRQESWPHRVLELEETITQSLLSSICWGWKLSGGGGGGEGEAKARAREAVLQNLALPQVWRPKGQLSRSSGQRQAPSWALFPNPRGPPELGLQPTAWPPSPSLLPPLFLHFRTQEGLYC